MCVCVCVCVCVMSQAHHALHETDVALHKLQEVLAQYPSWIDPEFLNICTELSLSNQQYQKVYEVDAI